MSSVVTYCANLRTFQTKSRDMALTNVNRCALPLGELGGGEAEREQVIVWKGNFPPFMLQAVWFQIYTKEIFSYLNLISLKS